jgi:hypothetical protein
MQIVQHRLARSAFPLTRGGCNCGGMVCANMTLRFGSVRVPAVVHWPQVETVPLAFVLSDELSPVDLWVTRYIVVALTTGQSGAIELAALQWVSEHRGEFGTDDDRVLVAGGARAAGLALATRDSGWPCLQGQLLVHPRFTAEQRMPAHVAGAPPATVVCGTGPNDGRAYAERLRAAGVEVDEVHDDKRR